MRPSHKKVLYGGRPFLQPKYCSIHVTNTANIKIDQCASFYLYTAEHQVQKLNSVSKRIMTEVAEDVEKAQVRDGGVALCRGHHLVSTAAAGLHRPRQESIHHWRAARQPL